MSFELKGMYDSVDQKSVEDFVGYLADDVLFRFGNSPTLVGKQAVREAISMFFTQIESIEHVLQEAWSQGDTSIMQFDTYYTRLDGVVVGMPGCVIVHFNDQRLIKDYRIHIDLSPLQDSSPDSHLIRKSA